MKIIIHWIILTLAIIAVSKFIPGITIDSIKTAIIVGVCLTFINLIIKPILNLLTLPINILTLGLFSLVINGAIFYWLGSVISGFGVENFKAAFIGALIVSVINWISNRVTGE
ncbi:MAG: phage holin family protein [Candidatus Paceibacterota bacterium]|jgi:putative membrane protein